MIFWVLHIDNVSVEEFEVLENTLKYGRLANKKTGNLIRTKDVRGRITEFMLNSEGKPEFVNGYSTLDICLSKKEVFQKRNFLLESQIEKLKAEKKSKKRLLELEKFFLKLWTKRF